MASTESKTEPEDVDSINHLCRLCLSEESVVSIFTDECLLQWISDYLSITVSVDDNMSQSICSICRIRLNEFHHFRLRCQEVQDLIQWTSWPSVDEVQMEMDPDEAAIQVHQNHKDKALEYQKSKKLHQKQNTEDELRDRIGAETRNDSEFNKSIANDHFEHSGVTVQLEPDGVLDSSYQIEQDQGTNHDTGIHNQPLGLECMVVVENVKVEVRKDDTETVNDETRKNGQPTGIEEVQPSITDIYSSVFPVKQKRTQHKIGHRKDFACSVCGKAYLYSSWLQAHVRSHLTVYKSNHQPKPYRCAVCHKSFVSRDHLVTHRKQAHKVSVTNQTKQCDLCGYYFSPKQLLAHIHEFCANRKSSSS